MTDVAQRRAGRRPEIKAVADRFVGLMRSFAKARARMLAAAEHDVEWSAHMVLKCIDNEGPMRASAVAELLLSDPSTVSRQVASLVKDGLLERRSDPDDGRASLLALTPKAADVLAEHDRIRLEHFARMLESWSDADLHRFASLLDRFTQAYEAANRTWINDRIETRSGRTGSTD
ncbi:MAG TPA: MarR family transcriptional regulator [Jatrophihabitantaceae bacterium]|nr:MarR family transcriptional regulator [Jatrophihabitantaceae bacterium]